MLSALLFYWIKEIIGTEETGMNLIFKYHMSLDEDALTLQSKFRYL